MILLDSFYLIFGYKHSLKIKILIKQYFKFDRSCFRFVPKS